MLNKQKGFTLIELMIVVAIVGILGAIGYPAYQEHVEKSRRTDGTGSLLNAANLLERCATVNGSYNHANCGAGVVNGDSTDGHYAITLTAVTASTFTITATPQGVQAGDNDECPNFTLTNAGVKTPDPGTDANRCWAQ